MAEVSFPFNSVSGDRRYKSEDWARYFALFLSNGVFWKDALQLKVLPDEGMKIKLTNGTAFIQGRGYENESEKVLTLDAADGTLSRIDRIVLRCDYAARIIEACVKKGPYSAQPTAPTLQRDADAYEIAVADISVTNGTVTITEAAISDLRLNSELCGKVVAMPDHMDTTELFNQVQAIIDQYEENAAQSLNDLQTQIDGIITTNDHMLKTTYDTNNDGRVNAADDATNGIRLYAWADGALTGAGENGKFYYPADADATTVSSITINGTGHSVAQGENDSIALLPGTWYTFTLDSVQHTINFSVGSSKYDKFVMALSTVGDASYWTLTGDKSATAGYYVSTYTGAVDEFIINGVTHAVSEQNDSAVDLVEGNVYTFVLTDGDDGEPSDLSNVTAFETVSGGVSPIITVQTVSRDEAYLKIVDITGTTITDNIVGASAYEQAVGGGYEGDKDSFETALAELPSALQEQTDARTDFAGTAQTNLNERINSDVAMLLDRFNAATSVPYEGEFINASNTYLGTMRETKIKGKTYQNLARLDLPASELFETFNGTEENEQITLVGKSAMQYAFYKYNLQLFKPSTDYTVVLKVMANSSNKQFFATSATDTASAYQPVFATQIAVNAGESGIFKFLATTKSDISNCSCVLKSYLPSNTTGSITYSFMILEGDYTNIDLPSTITGIESVSGELVETSTNADESEEDTFTYPDITLCSLPDGTCDYIDKQNDCWVQNVGKAVITGNETIVVNSHTTGQKYCSLDNIAATIANASIFCNLYQASAWTMENGKVYIPNGNSIVINDNNFTDVATAKAIFTEKFNSGEPVTVYYPLATPIVHQLPCRELKSYDGTTNISIAGSNISPTTATRIPSDTGAMVANLQNENAALTSQINDTNNAILAQGGNNV